MIDEIEALMIQKREIENRIRELKQERKQTERCVFKLEHYPTSRPDEWKVLYKTRIPAIPKEERNKCIIASPDRKFAVVSILDVINDLQELYDSLVEEYYSSELPTSKENKHESGMD